MGLQSSINFSNIFPGGEREVMDNRRVQVQRSVRADTPPLTGSWGAHYYSNPSCAQCKLGNMLYFAGLLSIILILKHLLHYFPYNLQADSSKSSVTHSLHFNHPCVYVNSHNILDDI